MKKSRDILYPLRRLHGWFYEHKKIYVIWLQIKGYFKSRSVRKKETDEDYPVDFVITWVDGNDPVWREKKKKYTQDIHNNKDGEERFRDWDIFKYWFRAVEAYAPWVNKVYLVTDKQIPQFLNVNCDKVVIVDHTDIIDKEFLPTFNSCAIEANINKIKGLSEHFIYFNDDMFLTKPVSKSDFFKNGLPKYVVRAKNAVPPCGTSLHAFQVFYTMGVLNSIFNIRESINKNPEKWFSYKNSSYISKNANAYKECSISSMDFSHLGVPYRKSTLDTVTEKLIDKFCETSSHRFRSVFDIVHYIFSAWEIMSGTFEPVEEGYYGRAFQIGFRPIFVDSLEAIREKKYMMVCLNDNEWVTNEMFMEMKSAYCSAFEDVLPQKSIFEK